MLKKSKPFNFYFSNIKGHKKNIRKTKHAYKEFLKELNNDSLPLLNSYNSNYISDFSRKTINKFLSYKNLIIIGMGGSILGAKSIYSFLGHKTKKKVFFFDNLDLNINQNYKKIKNLNNSCFVVISKSGNTLETIANLGSIFSKKIFKNKLIIITEFKDSALMHLANKFNAEIIEHKEFIGGRYSVLSEPGMFPAALMGLNIKKFRNLKSLLKNKSFVSSLIQNVSFIYTLSLKKINNSVILNYYSGLNDLSYWYQQLVAESLGKKGKGINPIVSFGPKDHHSLLQLYLDGPRDKFFTFMHSLENERNFSLSNDVVTENMKNIKNKKLSFIINAQLQATINVFRSKKIPFRQILFKKRNERELGNIFTFFVLETILLSKLMKVNPFDQPAVEEVKIKTKKYLR
tara:strand:+ start:2060 stop:3268 length:1209 start_codon:yes stop_codon:yes gene_type:complete